MTDAALRTLAPYEAGNWVFSENAGYYVHNGRVYLQGEISAQGQSGITAQILSGLPPGIAPATSQSFTLTADIGGTDDTIDPALALPLTYAATLHPDGSMALDAPPPSSVTATPPGIYVAVDIGTGAPVVHDRYSSPFDLLIALASVSWSIADLPDAYSATSFAPYLGPDFENIDATAIRHGARIHLDGHVRATVDGAYRLCTALPEALRPGGPDADRNFGVTVCHDPRHGRVATFAGDQALVFSNDQPPTVPPHHWGDPLNDFSGLFSFGEHAQNIFRVSLTDQQGDDRFGPGERYSCPVFAFPTCIVTGSFECGVIAPDGSGGATGPFGGGATGSIAALVADYDPLPDWVIIGASGDVGASNGVSGCLPCIDPDSGTFFGGGCAGGSAGTEVGISMPGGTLVDEVGNPLPGSVSDSPTGSLSPSHVNIHGLLARGARAYTDAPDDPRTILLWPADEASGVSVSWAGIGAGGAAEWSVAITPFWERRKVYFKAGDVLDLTGCGWQAPFAEVPMIPTTLKPGDRTSGPRGTRRRLGAGEQRKFHSKGRFGLTDLVRLAESVGLAGESAAIGGAVAMAESGGDPLAINDNAGPPPSRDRGLWQINDVAHPDVSDACAFDPVCNAHAMYSISSGGTNWSPWVTFTTGAYLSFLDTARAIAGAVPHSATATAGAAGAGRGGQVNLHG